MKLEALVSTFAEAIGNYEGFFVTQEQAKARGIAWPTIAQKNGNPGNLRSWGDRPINKGYAQFVKSDGSPDPDAGIRALFQQVSKMIKRNLTFLTAFQGERGPDGKLLSPTSYGGYAPAADANNPKAYARFIFDFVTTRFPEAKVFNIDTPIIKLVDATPLPQPPLPFSAPAAPAFKPPVETGTASPQAKAATTRAAKKTAQVIEALNADAHILAARVLRDKGIERAKGGTK